MAEERLIRGVVTSAPSFVRGMKRVKDPQRQQAIRQTLRQLLFVDLDAPPAALHLHQLTAKKVPSALHEGTKVTPWTVHLTRDDTLKASFTLEDGTAYFRVCDEHDIVDKFP
ncbi:MAG: hypothetical protein RIQ53_3999 [Pseudomonadota bacterium]